MIADAMLRERLLAGLAGFFGVVALALATVGVYGVVAYATATRRREIGIRRALGARAGDVVRAVLGRIGIVTAAGVTAGVVLTLLVSTAAASLLYGVEPRDPRVLAMVVGAIAAAGLAAAAFPARRALQTDPVSVLKDE
jgi:ABC-type antimicrobial peptide transport system permease subunit